MSGEAAMERERMRGKECSKDIISNAITGSLRFTMWPSYKRTSGDIISCHV